MSSNIELRAAYLLNRLDGKLFTDGSMDREALGFIRERRLAVYHEWPSGHWQVTPAGWNFRNDVFAEEGR